MAAALGLRPAPGQIERQIRAPPAAATFAKLAFEKPGKKRYVASLYQFPHGHNILAHSTLIDSACRVYINYSMHPEPVEGRSNQSRIKQR
ncbi:MAG TPA: hypothetical protein VLA15_06375, partial [Desulfurivibrionaceae bacterium]|nr:hypothetical protein [Desulfurivibrionaceae bacterium]